MGINAIRFRAEGAFVVLQVCELDRTQYSTNVAGWRDAKVEDLLGVARFAGESRNIPPIQHGPDRSIYDIKFGDWEVK